MIYVNNGKKYEVESVVFGGTIINVNGTSITNGKAMGMGNIFTVFVEGNELTFKTFDEAYVFATTKQKNTCRI